jgi:hypothetical protein
MKLWMNTHNRHLLNILFVPVHVDAWPSLVDHICLLSNSFLWSGRAGDGWMSHQALFNQLVLVGRGAGVVYW